MAGLLILDMAVAVLMSATLFCFIVGIAEPPGRRRRMWFYGLYASAALATLTKGLIGFLVPGAIMFLWLLLYRQWHRLRPLHLPTGTLLFLAIAAPWHVLVALRNPDWAWFYFVHEHWLRFTSNGAQPGGTVVVVRAGRVGRTASLGGFSTVRAAASVGPAQRRSGRAGARLVSSRSGPGSCSCSSAPPVRSLPLTCCPLFPPLAVLIARRLTARVPAGAVGWRVGWITAGGTATVFAAAFATLAVRPTLLRNISLDGLRPWLLLAAGLLAAAIFLLWRAARGADHRRAINLTAVIAVLVFVPLDDGIAPRIDFFTTKAFARLIAQQARPGDSIYQYARDLPGFPLLRRARRRCGRRGDGA